jgi:hemerythrin-like metal-binding protein
METGIPLVDAQHRELMELLDAFDAALRSGAAAPGLREDLALISQRTLKHFQTEEQLMKDAGYPGRCAHADLHRDLVLKVRELQYRFDRGQPLDRSLATFLADWFDHHIQESDRDYAGFLRKGPGA